jgi:hypothetical protein
MSQNKIYATKLSETLMSKAPKCQKAVLYGLVSDIFISDILVFGHFSVAPKNHQEHFGVEFT